MPFMTRCIIVCFGIPPLLSGCEFLDKQRQPIGYSRDENGRPCAQPTRSTRKMPCMKPSAIIDKNKRVESLCLSTPSLGVDSAMWQACLSWIPPVMKFYAEPSTYSTRLLGGEMGARIRIAA